MYFQFEIKNVKRRRVNVRYRRFDVRLCMMHEARLRTREVICSPSRYSLSGGTLVRV